MEISYEDFKKVLIKVGTVLDVKKYKKKRPTLEDLWLPISQNKTNYKKIPAIFFYSIRRQKL